jgi:hypothetical protein
MGLGDLLLAFGQRGRFEKGGELLGGAEALDKLGHFGPAARLYDLAAEQFQFSAANSTYYATLDGRKRCCRLAEERGEEWGVANQWLAGQINENPPAFVEWYYNQQADMLIGRLRKLTAASDWAGLVRLADQARGFLRYASGNRPFLGQYNCDFFGGLGRLALRQYEAARPLLQRAYDASRGGRGNFEAAALGWDAFHLGRALYGLGDRRAEELFIEAADRFEKMGHEGGGEPAQLGWEDAQRMLSKVRAGPKGGGKPPSPEPRAPHWQVGERAFVSWSQDQYWYAATIRQVQGQRLYVRFDDGIEQWTTMDRATKINLAVGDQVQARWQGGRIFYPGRIAQRNGEQVFVVYDDGDQEWNTVSNLRFTR